ncbi:MAG: sigma 54-interacting transcriptional regulator [Planctomycetota bacterium]
MRFRRGLKRDTWFRDRRPVSGIPGWRGFHLAKAGDMDEGMNLLLDAAEKALASGSPQAARTWTTRALDVENAPSPAVARAEALASRIEEGRKTLEVDTPEASDETDRPVPPPMEEETDPLPLLKIPLPRVRSRVELLLVLAKAYVGEGRIASAEETLGTALLEAEKYERRDILAKAHLLLGRMNLLRRDYRLALKNLERAEREAGEDEPSVRLDALVLATRTHLENGVAQAALGNLLRARELSGRFGDPTAGILLRVLEGEITAAKGDPGRALMNLGRGLREARGLDRAVRGWALRGVGHTLRLSGAFDRSRRYFNHAGRSFLKAEEKLAAVAAFLLGAQSAALGGEISRMEKSLQLAEEVFGKIPLGGLRRIASAVKGIALLRGRETGAAAEQLEEGAKTGGRPEDDRSGWAFLYAAMSALSFAQRDSQTAIRQGRQAIALLETDGFLLERALICRFLASFASETGVFEPKDAKEVAEWASEAKRVLADAGLKAPAGLARVSERELLEAFLPKRAEGEPASAEAAAVERGGEAAGTDPARDQEWDALTSQRDSLLTLGKISRTINSELELSRLIPLIMDMAIEAVKAERGFLLLDRDRQGLSVEVARAWGGEAVGEPEFEVSRSIAEEVVRGGEPVLTTDAGADERYHDRMSVKGLRLKSVLCVPLRSKGKRLGAVYVEDRRERGAFGPADMDFLMAFADQAAVALENARLWEDLRKKTEMLEASHQEVENLNRELKRKVDWQAETISEMERRMEAERRADRHRYDYSRIVGKSEAMQQVFQILDRATDSVVPVLIVGESGTGKELVARAIHMNGPRKDALCAVENCAAISETLLETELFGHVKGAFTGAVADKKGLFEVADGGTLFLDEVGEMSPGMQAKLLRVLQDGEFRPVGGKAVKKVDVRMIYASNRDLRKEVAEGRFREDLFYRMNVLTVHLPPLRDRIEDIPLLVDHFLLAFAEAGHMPVTMTAGAVKRMLAYRWPGNVRELENEIKRAEALSDGEIRSEHLSPH